MLSKDRAPGKQNLLLPGERFTASELRPFRFSLVLELFSSFKLSDRFMAAASGCFSAFRVGKLLRLSAFSIPAAFPD